MNSSSFLTIFQTFEGIDEVKITLPAVLNESSRVGSKVIVHDCSIVQREAKWKLLQELNRKFDFHLILSSPVTMAQSRNQCLALGMELFKPSYICAIDDDHGYNHGFIPQMMDAMNEFYGKTSPNGLKYGLFTGCATHYVKDTISFSGGFSLPSKDAPPDQMGRANNCCRCAPTLHWKYVLKGWDVDEYPLSNHQCRGINLRNYHQGFTSLLVGNGNLMFDMQRKGQGVSAGKLNRAWDDIYTASDKRAVFNR
jgi:hypothetical protein